MKWGITKKNRESGTSLDSFQRDISRVFDDFFALTPSSMFEIDWTPSIDVEEDEKGIRVKAEIPGIDEKDLRVTLDQNILSIEGEKREERREEDKGSRYVLSERKFGSFHRSISLPSGVKAESIKASFKNGVLKVEIPRDESQKPRKIAIDVK